MNRTTLRMFCVAGFALVAASCSPANTGSSAPGGGAIVTGGTTSAGGSTQPVNSGGTTAIVSGGSIDTGGSGVTGGNAVTGGSPVQGGTIVSGGTTSAGGTTRTGGTMTTTGGTTTTTGGTTTTTGGTTTTTGGTTTTTGGTTRTGGTTSATGGTTTTMGGTTTTTGGTTRTGGTTTTTGGTTTATGGTTRTGGTTSAGGTTSTGGGTSVDPSTVVPWLNGYLWVGTCSNGSASGLDCPLLPDTGGACPNATSTTFANRGVIRTVTQTVGGTAGTTYTVTFEVRGVVGTRCYTGGTMRASSTTAPTSPETSNDGWYVGGTPLDSKWNTYEIHVNPPVPGSNALSGTDDVYYMNAFPSVSGGLDSWCEMHETFPMKYTASFPVTGGGTVKLVLHDSNCLGQMNCGGPNRQTTCANPRTIDVTGMPTPVNTPPSPQQPYKQSNGFYPQWLLFAARSVTSP